MVKRTCYAVEIQGCSGGEIDRELLPTGFKCSSTSAWSARPLIRVVMSIRLPGLPLLRKVKVRCACIYIYMYMYMYCCNRRQHNVEVIPLTSMAMSLKVQDLVVRCLLGFVKQDREINQSELV